VRLKVASRKSDLARWQAVQTARAFESLPEKPAVEFIFKASLGDQDLDTPLANMNAKGVFTEDFYNDLTEKRCDLVVHSWKDLPVEARTETEIAMTLPRADVRDLLLVPETA
jgi:hydroxymethylbilane synthase